MPKATRIASLAALLLSCSILGANAGWFDSSTTDKAPAAPAKDDKAPAAQPAMSLDESIRQAQLLRLAGKYDEAINHLSQVMLVAADDPRVISEYGKTLASMGRADEAVKFLTRAHELQPNDWSVYSALGVAYDESGDQKSAQSNYEHALALKPGEPSVLNNYALSRMMAKDPAMAMNLASRAEIANSVTQDPQITRNIAMIRSLAPQKDASVAINTPAPSPVPHTSVASAAPVPLVARSPLVPVSQPAPAAMASSAPRPINANAVGVAQLQPTHATAQPIADNRVVMERVPVDPLAGPVAAATHAPRSLKPKTVAKADVPDTSAKTDAPAPAKTAKADTAKPDDTKPVTAKPAPATQAKADAAKLVPAPKVLPSTPVKDAAAKPVVKAADAKPVPASVKTSKDAIPSLRMSANAY